LIWYSPQLESERLDKLGGRLKERKSLYQRCPNFLDKQLFGDNSLGRQIFGQKDPMEGHFVEKTNFIIFPPKKLWWAIQKTLVGKKITTITRLGIAGLDQKCREHKLKLLTWKWSDEKKKSGEEMRT
jgi:hypothetical protein